MTRSPLFPLAPRDAATPGPLSPARARAQHEVGYMQGKLPYLQTERDARVASVEVENSRVRQLEAEVVQRKQDVFSLKEQLDAASKAAAVAAETSTVVVKIDACDSDERAGAITA